MIFFHSSPCFALFSVGLYSINTSDRWRSKTLILSTKVDLRWFETRFLIAVPPPTGDKWQSKILSLAIFDPRSSIGQSVFVCRLSSTIKECIYGN